MNIYDRNPANYPVRKEVIEGFEELGEVGVVQCNKITKCPKDCYFDEISWQDYLLVVSTKEYHDECSITKDLCPQGLIHAEYSEKTRKLLAIVFMEPSYFELGEYSDWESIQYVLTRKVLPSILENVDVMWDIMPHVADEKYDPFRRCKIG